MLAVDPDGPPTGGGAVSSRTYLSIGDVLTLLREEFPDVTISKIRFLESQGLVNPERSPSGYRKFYDHDVERLRWVLRQQREHFLPLKVIRDRLVAEGDAEMDDATVLDDPSTMAMEREGSSGGAGRFAENGGAEPDAVRNREAALAFSPAAALAVTAAPSVPPASTTHDPPAQPHTGEPLPGLAGGGSEPSAGNEASRPVDAPRRPSPVQRATGPSPRPVAAPGRQPGPTSGASPRDADPRAAQPAQGAERSAAQPARAADPPAAQPARDVDPSSAQPARDADPAQPAQPAGARTRLPARAALSPVGGRQARLPHLLREEGVAHSSPVPRTHRSPSALSKRLRWLVA